MSDALTNCVRELWTCSERVAFSRQEWKKALVSHIVLNSKGPQGYRMPMTRAEAEIAAEKMIDEKITAWEESQC